MRKEIKIYLLIIVLIFVSLYLGINVFLTAKDVQDKFWQLFGFFLSICDFIICGSFVLFMGRYSKQIEPYLPKLVLSEEKEKRVVRIVNYIIFVVIVAMSLTVFFLLGVLFFISDESYWLFLNAVITIFIALIISYNPWFGDIKEKLYQSPWKPLFIIVIILLAIIIGLFALFSIR